MNINLENNMFSIEDLGKVYDAYLQHLAGDSTEWFKISNSYMKLPEWYDYTLDSDSDEYAEQQHKLWKIIANVDRDYVPNIDEQCLNMSHTDVIRFPGGFVNRHDSAVYDQGEHFISTGMIMKNSGIKPGQHVLEYGPGFGGIALQMARLGVNVDTVDITDYFVDVIKEQADFYGVPLNSFKGEFGYNPRGDMKYDLIFFYESFHHCLDFKKIVKQLKHHLAPNGVIMMAGEPIIESKAADIPFDWGIRMCAENVMVVRQRHWFELGFLEDYLVRIFINAGFVAEKMHCPVSHYGKGYIFRHRNDTINISSHWLPNDESMCWHVPEPTGKWSMDESYITLDTSDSFSQLSIDMENYTPVNKSVTLKYGKKTYLYTFAPNEGKTIIIDATKKAPKLYLKTNATIPSETCLIPDTRSLGIFVKTISYIK